VSPTGKTRQIDHVPHPQAIGNFPQLGAGGREETAQQPALIELLHPVVPALGAESEPRFFQTGRGARTSTAAAVGGFHRGGFTFGFHMFQAPLDRYVIACFGSRSDLIVLLARLQKSPMPPVELTSAKTGGEDTLIASHLIQMKNNNVEGSPMNEAWSELQKLDKEWSSAIVKNDAHAIGQFMSDDWVIIGPEGNVIERSRFLEVIESGDLTPRVHGIRRLARSSLR
jgi:hypothetical protein